MRKAGRYGLVTAAIFVSPQVYYILSRCSYLKDECPDKDKKGIKRLLNNGTYTAAFPLHDVSAISVSAGTSCSGSRRMNFIIIIIIIRSCETCCLLCACSPDTGHDHGTPTVKAKGTISTNTGPGSSASSRSSPSTSSGEQPAAVRCVQLVAK